MALPPSIFQETSDGLFKYRYKVTIHVGTLVGGTPANRDVATAWIETKMGLSSKERIRAEVEKVMDAMGVTSERAIEEVNRDRHLTGFMRDFGTPLALADQEKAMTTGFVFEGVRKIFTAREARTTFGELLIKARTVKAMIKEAGMIGVGSGHIDGTRWGKTGKAMKGFLSEHLFVLEEDVLLGVTEPSTIDQAFVHTWRGSGLKLEEKVHDAILTFTIIADWDFESKVPDFYAILFAIAEKNGLGASRSQGYGQFSVIGFERVESDAATTAKATKRARAILAEEKILEAERATAKATAKAAELTATAA